MHLWHPAVKPIDKDNSGASSFSLQLDAGWEGLKFRSSLRSHLFFRYMYFSHICQQTDKCICGTLLWNLQIKTIQLHTASVCSWMQGEKVWNSALPPPHTPPWSIGLADICLFLFQFCLWLWRMSPTSYKTQSIMWYSYCIMLIESFRVNRSNVLKVRAWTDPDLPSLVIFYVFQELKHGLFGNWLG